MRFLLAILVLLISFPAMAQEDTARKLELAKQMHEIWPVRIKVEDALDKVALDMAEDKRDTFKAAMRKAVKFDKLEEDSIKAMVETFTLEELEQMVAFYGSSVGRSISAKTEEYQARITPGFVEMLDKAMMDIKTGAAPGQMP